MAKPTISPFPQPPLRNQAPDVFNQNATAFLGHFPGFEAEVNAAIDWQNTTLTATQQAQAQAAASAQAAATSKANAATSEQNAAQSQSAAASSAEAASTSEANANSSAEAASTDAQASQAARTGAETAEQGAVEARNNAQAIAESGLPSQAGHAEDVLSSDGASTRWDIATKAVTVQVSPFTPSPQAGWTVNVAGNSRLAGGTVQAFEAAWWDGVTEIVAAQGESAMLHHDVAAAVGETVTVTVRALDDLGNPSARLSVSETVLDIYVATPSITTPAGLASDVRETPTLQSSAFAVEPGTETDTHAATSWRVSDSSGEVVWSSFEDADNLTSITLPPGVLQEGERKYSVQVRHHGATYGASTWSPAVTFATAARFGADIGEAGTQGFGVGVYPSALPSGFSAMSGSDDPASDNYGNYQYQDGSVMVFVPAFYYRIGHADSPRYAGYGANALDVVSAATYADRAAAAAAGYALHRAFIDAGQVKSGFFYDKYLASKNGNSTCRSVKGGVPISLTTTSTYTRSEGMSGCTGIYADSIVLARARGAGFNVASVFQVGAVALLSLAHAQAAPGTASCAWYDSAGVTNYPKGCNNNALGDNDDAEVTYLSAGDSGNANKPQTGSAAPFAKATHNGQACGIADVNGVMWQVALGITTPGASATATTQVTNGDSYVLKESVELASLTAGHGGATDAWGTAATLANNYDLQAGILPWGATTGAVYFGNGANQVFSDDTDGLNWLRTACGIQKDAAAMSASGTNQFGADYCYQYNRQNLCVFTAGNWSNAAGAGAFARYWSSSRTSNGYSVSFRASAYGL
jgi:hypothetical protein